MVLINTVLSSLPVYCLSFYKAPKKVVKLLSQIQMRLLWGEMMKLEKSLGLVGIWCVDIGMRVDLE